MRGWIERRGAKPLETETDSEQQHRQVKDELRSNQPEKALRKKEASQFLKSESNIRTEQFRTVTLTDRWEDDSYTRSRSS